MVNRNEKIRSRLGFSWSGWNHPVRAQLVGLILFAVGGGGSIYLQAVLAHRGITFFEHHDLYGASATAVGALTVYIVGMAVLALLD
ncbi:hypothetical protein [Haloarchaeobius sp. HRN-SO-5]|uniref:hypothetical protein n=1 Tax=Haloarchaeobius sp. HRN-SO-5 TaxID=3446118 RepID=UPI003EB9FCA0